jgi:uncharacterized protein (DUF2252 family)
MDRMTATMADSRTSGRECRAAAPRSSHADWQPPAGRRDPVDLLEEESASRLPELIPIRYGRMLVSPFTFFRGAAAIMAADLATTPSPGLRAQLCGDAHLLNFGVFRAPDRRLVFDLNDFDETNPGPFEWDVKRLATSIEIAGRDRGFTARRRREAVVATVRRYREAMRSFASMGHLDVWYSRVDEDSAAQIVPPAPDRDGGAARRVADKARAKDNLRAVARLAERVDGRLQIRSDPPLVLRVNDLLPEADADEVERGMRELLGRYAKSLPADRRHLFSGYRVVDMARKVVGVGSVGTRAWVILFEGHDERDPLVLQAKEAEASVLEPYAGPSPYRQHGRRVVEGQRLMQAASDILLGWLRAEGTDGVEREFYVRQLWDGKGSFDPSTMTPQTLGRYGQVCAWTLARAHARSGDRAAIAAYLGSGDRFDRALAVFASAYADQNEADYAALLRAAADGRVAVQTG